MKRIKDRWGGEFPEKRRTAQNLVDNVSRFEKEGWGGKIVRNQTTKMQKNTEWNTEMKITLIIIDEEERHKGRGFMKRVQERWDAKHPEHPTARIQKLRDNASRFKKDHEIMNLMLVRKRTKISRQYEHQSKLETEQQDNPTNGIPLEALKESVEKDGDKELPVQIKDEDEELERLFTYELQHMVCSNMSELEPREKLHKLVMPKEIQENANRIMGCYIPGEDPIPSITDKVYAMEKAIEKKMAIDPNEKKKHTSKRLQNGNRKLKGEIKQLRRLIPRTSNEIYPRKQRRKGTPKEKKILKQLKKTMNKTELTTSVLMKHKEVWIDKLRYKQVKLVKMIERGKRIMDNNIFERDQKNFFKRIEDSTE